MGRCVSTAPMGRWCSFPRSSSPSSFFCSTQPGLWIHVTTALLQYSFRLVATHHTVLFFYFLNCLWVKSLATLKLVTEVNNRISLHPSSLAAESGHPSSCRYHLSNNLDTRHGDRVLLEFCSFVVVVDNVTHGACEYGTQHWRHPVSAHTLSSHSTSWTRQSVESSARSSPCGCDSQIHRSTERTSRLFEKPMPSCIRNIQSTTEETIKFKTVRWPFIWI